MTAAILVQNDRQMSDVEARLRDLRVALSSEEVFANLVRGLSVGAINGIRTALEREIAEYTSGVSAYAMAKQGKCDELFKSAGSDLGLKLIATRICRGLSQKELARKLGLKEQAIQRWEAEQYKSINLSNFQLVARALNVQILLEDFSPSRLQWTPSFSTPVDEANKVLRHAKRRGWVGGEDSERLLAKRISDHVLKHGTPSLLRTGLKTSADVPDWSLIAWKAQVTWKAESVIPSLKAKFALLNFGWLQDLVKLSCDSEGPSRAKQHLAARGIILIIEPQVPGMKVDGAAFLVDGFPVIGMTLIRDSVDNFWFTLLHELAHVILHFRTGLVSGFFDEMESEDGQVDEMEREADAFASNLLIPDEVWRSAPARIAKDPQVVTRLAQKLEIGSEVIFGRIRMERKNYAIFTDRIGQGKVRKLFPEYEGV